MRSRSQLSSTYIEVPLVSKLLDSVLSGLLASVEAISRELDSGRGGQEMDSGLRVPLEMYAFTPMVRCRSREALATSGW